MPRGSEATIPIEKWTDVHESYLSRGTNYHSFLNGALDLDVRYSTYRILHGDLPHVKNVGVKKAFKAIIFRQRADCGLPTVPEWWSFADQLRDIAIVQDAERQIRLGLSSIRVDDPDRRKLYHELRKIKDYVEKNVNRLREPNLPIVLQRGQLTPDDFFDDDYHASRQRRPRPDATQDDSLGGPLLRWRRAHDDDSKDEQSSDDNEDGRSRQQRERRQRESEDDGVGASLRRFRREGVRQDEEDSQLSQREAVIRGLYARARESLNAQERQLLEREEESRRERRRIDSLAEEFENSRLRLLARRRRQTRAYRNAHENEFRAAQQGRAIHDDFTQRVSDIPSFRSEAAESFVERVYGRALEYCQCCHGSCFRTPAADEALPYTLKQVERCKECTKTAKDRGMPSFGAANGFDIYNVGNAEAMREYRALPVLTILEEMLIARLNPIMQVRRLRNGTYKSAGCCLNFVQDIQPIATVLPLLLSEVSVVIVKRQIGPSPEELREFKVNRYNLQRWLLFLKRYNKYYADITIDESRITAIPDNASGVYDLIRDASSASSASGEGREEEEDEENVGIHQGPVADDAVQDDFISGVGGRAPVFNEAAVGENILQGGSVEWPARVDGSVVDEYSQAGLFVMTFPCKFPFGHGDPTDKMRVRDVTLNDAMTFFARYTILQESGFIKPFDSDPRFSHYLQDVEERRRLMSQANQFLKSNPTDANKTVSELLNTGGNDYASLRNRLTRFGSNIPGSAGYFSDERKVLQSLIEQCGMPHTWFTLSFAEMHWEDLNALLGVPPGLSDAEQEVWFWKRKKENPGLLDELFTRRVRDFVETFYGERGYDAEWWWYRFEWQARGAIHVHGMTRVKHWPELSELSEKIYFGRKAEEELASRQGGEELDAWYKLHPDDKYTQGPSMPNKSEADLSEIAREGKEAETALVSIIDETTTAWNFSPELPEDASADTRSPYVPRSSDAAPHPCRCGHRTGDVASRKYSNVTGTMYNDLCNEVLRHRCNKDYCLDKDGKCRFGFPFKLADRTSIAIEEKPYKNRPELRTVAKTIIYRRNDRWMNKHNHHMPRMWLGNCDFAPLIDSDQVVAYVCKYGTKSEKPSKAYDFLFRNVMTTAHIYDRLGKTALRSLFIKLFGAREKTQQETAHLMLSGPFVCKSKNVVSINLRNEFRQVHVDEDSGQASVKMTLMDAYALRNTDSVWLRPEIQLAFIAETNGGECNFSFFARRFYLRGRGRDAKLLRHEDEKMPVVTFSPDYYVNVNSKGFVDAAFLCLLKWAVWENFVENVYGGEAGQHSTEDEVCAEKIKASFQALSAKVESGSLPLYQPVGTKMALRIGRMLDPREGSEFDDDFPRVDDIEDDIDDDRDAFLEDWMAAAAAAQKKNNAEWQEGEPMWDRHHDFSVHQQVYSEEDTALLSCKVSIDARLVLTQAYPEAAVDDVTDEELAERRRAVLSELRGLQRVAADVVLHRLDEVKDIAAREPTVPPTVRGIMVLTGIGGAGKSFVINAIVQSVGQNRVDGSNPAVLKCAYSGKAASGIGGLTIHSLFGIRPGKDVNFNDNSHVQQMFRGVRLLIIDEFSMVGAALFSAMWRKLEASLVSRGPGEGDLCVMLVGDPGQIPPVGDSMLWDKSFRLSAAQKIATLHYANFESAIRLVVSNRLKNVASRPLFLKFLDGLRNGNMDLETWQATVKYCSEEAIVERVGRPQFESKFKGPGVTSYFSGNEEREKHNAQEMFNGSHPVAQIDAVNDPPTSRSGSEREANKIPNSCWVRVGMRVMYLHNSDVRKGLVNGVTGTVMDIIYAEGAGPPALPLCIVVKMDVPLKGVPFFSDPEKKNWHVIVPIEAKWTRKEKRGGGRGTTLVLSRIGFPITACWGMTGHKSQGTTNSDGAICHFDEKARTPNIDYVVVSRSVELENVLFKGCVSYERLSSQLRTKVLECRLKEEERLEALSALTIEKYKERTGADINF